MPSLRKLVERPLFMLAVTAMVAWCLTAFQFAAILLGEDKVAPYYWIQFFVSFLGLLGCLGWLLFWQRWRYILIAAAVLYLSFHLLRFYKHLLVWSDASIWQAIWQTLGTHWSLFAHYFSKGWILSGFGLVYFEWGMPLLQITVVVLLVTSNPSFKRDCRKSATAP